MRKTNTINDKNIYIRKLGRGKLPQLNAIYPNPSDIRLSSEKLIDFFLILRTGKHSPIHISVEYYIGSPRLWNKEIKGNKGTQIDKENKTVFKDDTTIYNLKKRKKKNCSITMKKPRQGGINNLR